MLACWCCSAPAPAQCSIDSKLLLWSDSDACVHACQAILLPRQSSTNRWCCCCLHSPYARSPGGAVTTSAAGTAVSFPGGSVVVDKANQLTSVDIAGVANVLAQG